jgi:hypothetical protein
MHHTMKRKHIMHSNIKKLVLATVTAAAVVSPMAITGTAHADAGSLGCVTRHEYSEVTKGMSVDKVARIFGTKGKVSYSYIGSYVWEVDREYKPCQPYTAWSHVEVDFGKRHGNVVVTGKSAFWIS